jgi:hypothetical protein
MGACALRIAAVSALTDTSSIGEHRSSPAAWRMPSPHAPLTHIKPLALTRAVRRTLPPDFVAVTDFLGQRLVVLAAVALLGGVVALAIVERTGDGHGGLTGAVAPAGWNTAFAGARGPAGDAQRTTCGQVLADRSLGVTHPVLPCGAKVILRYGDKQVLTEVIDNALVEPGRQLEVTQALGRMLELGGTAEIEWRFATEAGS